LPKPLFQCEKCSSIHGSEKEANVCEKSHLEPERQALVFSQADRRYAYPSEVKMWFKSKCVTYTREG